MPLIFGMDILLWNPTPWPNRPAPPPKSRSRPWYWPFGKPKYNQMQTRENDTEEYELGGLVYWAH